MDYRRSSRFDEQGGTRHEEPRYSRLFIIGGKSCSEDEMRRIFSEFGEVEFVSVKKDRNTMANKGFAYVKFKKTSQAAIALEEMSGKCIGTDTRPIKVVIASERTDGPNEEITATRLFIKVPKTMEIPDIKDAFSAFGSVEHVSLVRDKATGNPRGLAYVNYHKFSDAATAVENADRSFQAQFAEPKTKTIVGKDAHMGNRHDNMGSMNSMGSMGGMGNMGGMGGGYGDMGGYQQAASQTMMGMMQYQQTMSTSCRLKVLFNPSVSKDMFWMLFNIVPGLVSCDLVEITTEGAIGCVTYSNPQSAAYALERINGFEYPTGSRIQIKVDESTGSMSTGMSMGPGSGVGGSVGSMSEHSNGNANVPSDIKSLINTIQQATETLKSTGFGNLVGGGTPGVGAGMGGGGGGASIGGMNTLGYKNGSVDAQNVCSAKLPPKQPVLPANTKTEERLFFVMREAMELPDPAIITDTFCRFGNLIDAQCIRGKKCGYARYANKESASHAISVLNGEDLLGSRIKVEVADEDRRPKRARVV